MTSTISIEDLDVVRRLRAGISPWAGADEEELLGAPAVRRSGQVTAVLGADAGATARLGTVLAAPGNDADLADLYAELAEGWVAAGILTHTVNVPAGAAEAVWYDLSFGRQQAYAIGEVAAMPAPPPPGRVTVAEVGIEELDEVLQFRDFITRHQALSPVFSRATEPFHHQLREAWTEVLTVDETRCFLARRDGAPVGFLLSEDAEAGPLAPPGAVELRVAAVAEGARGGGVGSALAHAFVADARARGAAHAVCDWRTTNLLASRFWPRWGFRPFAYRLVRTIDLTPFA